MIQIDDLDRAGKCRSARFQIPFGSIAYDDFLRGAAPVAVPGFQIKPFPKLFRRLDSACVSGGIRVADP